MNALLANADFGTRRARRNGIKPVIACLSAIREAEQKSLDNTPENFRDSEAFESGEHAVETLEEIIGLLADVY